MDEYICDDKLNEEKLADDIANMSDEEFKKFNDKVKEIGKYPEQYYMN